VVSESIVVECELPESPEKVWRALTERDLLGAWLMANDMRPQTGARFRFTPGPDETDAGPADCEILEAVPHRKLCWRQSERIRRDSAEESVDSVVTIELIGTPGGGTRLRVVHDGFEYRESSILCRLRRAA
jgi:uncharacterized protein YndB with AHSA1/START domain